MRQHLRHIQCLVWLVLASVTAVVLDGRSAARTDVLALTRVTRASTHTRQPLVLGAMRHTWNESGGAHPIDLEPVDGLPLTYAERDSIVRLARTLVGSPYELGGTNPDRGFDCSGLVAYVLAQMHMHLPRRADEQAKVGDAVDRNQLRPGDLLTFGRDTVSHVGIYIGGGEFIHASSVAHRVIVSRLDRPASALIRPLHGGRRLLVMASGARKELGG